MPEAIEHRYSQLVKIASAAEMTQEDMWKLAPLLPQADGELNDLLAWASAERDAQTFVEIALAAAWVERGVDIDLLLRSEALIPNTTVACALAARASGDLIGRVIEEFRSFRLTTLGATVFMFAAAWSARTRTPGRLDEVVEAAALLPKRLTEQDGGVFKLLAALADYLDDPRVDPDYGRVNVTKGTETGLRKEIGSTSESLLRVMEEPLDAWMPKTASELSSDKRTIRRAAPKVGRNDPCPCDSGRKYKKCCLGKDQERLRDSSHVAGKTRHELAARIEEDLTPETVRELRVPGLLGLDLSRVAPDMHPHIAAALNRHRELTGAARLYEAVGVVPELRPHLVFALNRAAAVNDLENLRRLAEVAGAELLDSPEVAVNVRLLLGEVERSPAIEMLEAAVRRGLDDDESLMETSYAMHRWGCSALGAALARSVIAARPRTESVTMLRNLIAEARTGLDLDPEDQSFPLCAKILEEGDEETAAEALIEHKRLLELKTSQNQKLLSNIYELQREFDREKKHLEVRVEDAATPGEAGVAAEEASELQEMRRRLATIKEELKNRHDERNSLRSELETVQQVLQEQQARLNEVAAKEDADGAYDEREEERLLAPEERQEVEPPRIPVFHARFERSVESLPAIVKRAALRDIGALAAGDASAFTNVRKLQLRPEYHRYKLKRDYRLILKKLEGQLEFVEILNRKDLERRIPTLP